MLKQNKLMENERFVNAIMDMVIIGGTYFDKDRNEVLFNILKEEGFLSKSVKYINVYCYIRDRNESAMNGFSITISETFESYSNRRTQFYFTRDYIERWCA